MNLRQVVILCQVIMIQLIMEENFKSFFMEELNKDTARMLNTAQLSDAFHSPTENDKEGTKTRWNDTPTALLVLLRRAPNAASRELEFMNGERIAVSYGPFNYPLALALHRNAIKVPRYLVQHAAARQPSWLGNQIQDAVLGVVDSDSTACNLFGCDGAPSYLLEFHHAAGLSHTRNSAASFTPTLDPSDDSWF